MELRKKKLATALQKDLKSFVENLPENLSDEASRPSLQSKLLLESDLPPPSCEMGRILMTELLQPQVSDTVLKIENERFFCHKEVLSSRCEYFRAMLRNTWTEANSKEITLSNIKPKAMAALLCFLYGASIDFPKFCSLLDVLQISDMFGVTGLTYVVVQHIKVEICHSFHKPCKECITNAPEAIQLASIFSLNDLLTALLKWNAKYFYKLWPTKGFASLQTDIQGKCGEAVVSSMTPANVIHLLIETDKLLSSIPRVQWTKPVVDMGTNLMTSCCDFIASNVLNLTTNKTMLILFQGMGWKTDIIERILHQIGYNLRVDDVSNAHLAVGKLIYFAEKEDWIEEFTQMLLELKKKIWEFLISNYFAVIHTEPWQRVSSFDKMTLKSETLCQGDENTKLSKRPILSSSLQKKSSKPSVVKRPPTKPQQGRTNERRIGQQRNSHKLQGQKRNNEIQNDEPPTRTPIIVKEELIPGIVVEDTKVEPPALLPNFSV